MSLFKKSTPPTPTGDIDSKPLIDTQDALERLMLFMERHNIDEVVLPNVTVRKSVHIMPEEKRPKLPQHPSMQDLIGLSSDN